MKNKYLILIISCIVLLVVLLIIIHTCAFFPTASAPDIQEVVTDKIPETDHDTKNNIPKDEKIKKEDIKPVSTAQDYTEAAPPTRQEEKKPALETLFEYFTEYNGHTYYISKDIAYWKEAVAICPNYGVHLVTITSSEENKAVIEAIKAKKIDKDVWIGLSDHKFEGIWRWITGEERSFTYWDAMQPDNFLVHPGRQDGRGEDFACIWQHPHTKMAYHWNDASYKTTALFILEIESK